MHPTRDELKRACEFAHSEARAIRFSGEDELTHWMVWAIGEQLGCGISCTVTGYHDVNDMPVLAIHTEHLVHHIAMRDIRVAAPEPKPSPVEKARQLVTAATDQFRKKR